MKNAKKLSLGLLLLVAASTQTTTLNQIAAIDASDADVITAPGVFAALDGFADSVTFGDAGQTKAYVNQNSKNGNASSKNITAGKDLLTNFNVPVDVVTLQESQEGNRNFRDTNGDAQAKSARYTTGHKNNSN